MYTKYEYNDLQSFQKFNYSKCFSEIYYQNVLHYIHSPPDNKSSSNTYCDNYIPYRIKGYLTLITPGLYLKLSGLLKSFFLLKWVKPHEIRVISVICKLPLSNGMAGLISQLFQAC